ncbi:hypothetical protein CIPAW_11G077600 [Carya illinoinensis]|uniref:Uncharacterized protein n=1 Tax=Carya illinoinensis TaxID=32201 RepID=A0A8T1P4T3_CARIL|nr:hypothetical protein CIPAW_11G077600 [Carya illinoinensis]
MVASCTLTFTTPLPPSRTKPHCREPLLSSITKHRSHAQSHRELSHHDSNLQLNSTHGNNLHVETQRPMTHFLHHPTQKKHQSLCFKFPKQSTSPAQNLTEHHHHGHHPPTALSQMPSPLPKPTTGARAHGSNPNHACPSASMSCDNDHLRREPPIAQICHVVADLTHGLLSLSVSTIRKQSMFDALCPFPLKTPPCRP